MKEESKMKENTGVQPMSKANEAMPMQMPMGTMPATMPTMNSMPMTMPAQMPSMNSMPMTMPTQMPTNVMPMETMPMAMPMMQMPMICCPYLMNIQCPMLYSQSMMAPMPTGVSPVSGNMSPKTNMGDPSMMGQYQFPMGGM